MTSRETTCIAVGQGNAILPVTLRAAQLAPDAVGICPSPRLAEEIDDPVRVTKVAGLDEHASERDQFILIRPPVTGTTVPTFGRRHDSTITTTARRIDPKPRAALGYLIMGRTAPSADSVVTASAARGRASLTRTLSSHAARLRSVDPRTYAQHSAPRLDVPG